MNLGQALIDAEARLKAAGVESPGVDARLLAAHALGVAPLEVGLHRREEAPLCFLSAVHRREQREPLQYIVGQAPFFGVDLQVGPGVFIPRPETEVLAEWAMTAMRKAWRTNPIVVDLCAGSGALAITLARALPGALVHAVEKSPAALDYLQRNVDKLAPSVTVHEADATDPTLLAQLIGAVDLVVSNPPYVPENPGLSDEVYHDPHEAVFSGDSGMDVISGMLAGPVPSLLRPGGLVGIEHDDTTAKACRNLLESQGDFDTITSRPDLTGTSRFVTARKLPH